MRLGTGALRLLLALFVYLCSHVFPLMASLSRHFCSLVIMQQAFSRAWAVVTFKPGLAQVLPNEAKCCDCEFSSTVPAHGNQEYSIVTIARCLLPETNWHEATPRSLDCIGSGQAYRLLRFKFGVCIMCC